MKMAEAGGIVVPGLAVRLALGAFADGPGNPTAGGNATASVFFTSCPDLFYCN
ncbi:MAG: hypothetical protein PHV28_16220 [Kiritimatiellae bacterium]|nr:hypothetical protein [Kiritimatiellia bacterium]